MREKKHIFITAICVNLLNTSLFVTVKLFITFSKNSLIEEGQSLIKIQNFKFSAEVIMAAILVDMVTNQEYDWASLEFPEVRDQGMKAKHYFGWE